MSRWHRAVWAAGLAAAVGAAPLAAMDLVVNGKAAATIVVDDPPPPAEEKPPRARRPPRSLSADARAAAVLVEWIGKMTGAEVPVAAVAEEGRPAIYVGAAAVRAGLRLDDLQSPSREGLRVLCEGRRALVAGQNDTATVKAACRLLEQLGCRYFVDHPLGEVYPRTKTLRLKAVDLREQPGFLYRSIWGSKWSGQTLWKIWNGAGGEPLAMGHAWGGYVSKGLFDEHPDYFRLRRGQREPSDWFCTSNAGLRDEFTKGVLARLAGGAKHVSISPPDGVSYCECDACRAQDDPRSLEPSSGRANVTNRYLDFYQYVARRVAKQHPDAILNFYCYADYTAAPTNGVRLEPNLCAWIAPIRYCRFHAIGHADCPSRVRLERLVEDWKAAAQKIAYRTYNYNLAECLVPFSMISVWKHDIPYLKRQGCIGINLESLANWQIYGPHLYLSIRLAYDPQADADALMDDYFAQFYGAAGPAMKSYWLGIDRAFAVLPSHAGSFFALPLVYTPEFLRQCRGRLDEAAAVVRSDATLAARVAMAAEGLANAEQYAALRDALNRGDGPLAQRRYDELLARSEANDRSGLGNHYTVAYLKRFIGPPVAAAAAATAAPNKLLAVLPDEWRLTYDPDSAGVEKGFARPEFDDAGWTRVATFGKPLDAQGLPDRQTVMWYRTRVALPQKPARGGLQFLEVDGDATVFVNGQAVGGSAKKRAPFAVDAGAALKAGENTIAVRVDHSAISELFLGGIVRPVYVVE